VEVSSRHDDRVIVSGRAILECDGVARNTDQNRLGVKVVWPLVWHRVAPEAARNTLRSILPAHGCDVLGGEGCADNQDSLVFEILCISDVMSMDDPTLEITETFDLRHIRGAKMSASNYHIVELLDEIGVVVQLSRSDSEFLCCVIKSHTLDTGIGLDPVITLVLLEAAHDVLVERLSWWKGAGSLSEVVLESIVCQLKALLGSIGE